VILRRRCLLLKKNKDCLAAKTRPATGEGNRKICNALGFSHSI
jgi:hypothetical protein